MDSIKINQIKRDNKYYKHFYINSLEEMKKSLSTLKEETDKMINKLLDSIDEINTISKEIQNSLDSYILFIKSLKQPHNKNILDLKEKYINEIEYNLKKYNDNIILFFENNHIHKIKNLQNQLNYYMIGISDPDFNPPNIEEFINTSSIDIKSYYTNNETESENNELNDDDEDFTNSNNIYKNESEQRYNININHTSNKSEEKDDINIKCPICNDNKVICFCEHCNQLFCKICKDNIMAIEKEKKDHKIIYIDTLKTKSGKQINLFLNSLNNIIKYILKSCSYILDNRKIELIPLDNNNNKSKIEYIKRIYDFPFFTEVNNLDAYKKYLSDIQDLLGKEFNINNLDINKFHISEINERIINSVRNILADENLDLIKETMSNIDQKFISDDDYSEESYDADNNKEKFDENEFKNNKNKFYYVLYIISKSNNIGIIKTNAIKNFVINKIKKYLDIEINNILISFNNRNYFIDTIIKTQNFSDSSIKKIKKDYPGFNQLYEYKFIYDNILNIDLKNKYFDFKGNTINPNSSYNIERGTEKYDPPYGWFGIGLNVINKYESNKDWLENKTNNGKWAIAYHGIGQYLPSNKVKEALINIITKDGLVPGKSQHFKNNKDKRHPGKEIGEGIYLSPSINLAEKYSGIISIKKKRYKVILMAKVLIEKIREPNEIQFWILDKKDIRIYRILVKEIK